MSAGAIAMALFGSFILYGGLAYCIYRALKSTGR
ncbi:MAG TPA: MetS family NSS transporter small subunit [Thermoplasmata archaeon]|nr:MetS family NSS transporter small subunit [Thermoplasmata archaeon]